MAYTTGIRTFTAHEDIQRDRVVVLHTSSIEPFEVELASSTSTQLYGVSKTSARAGELISVQPLDHDGTLEIESAGVIAVGNNVYVYDGTGRVNDEERDARVGRALSSASAGQLVTVALVMSHGDIKADNVEIDDAGDYFTSDDVEGALQEVGSTLDTHTTDIGTLQTDLTNLTAVKAVEEWFQFEGVYRCQSGLPEATTSREIKALSEMGVPADKELVYYYQNTTGNYGDFHLRVQPSGSLDEFEDWIAFPIKPNHKIHTASDVVMTVYGAQESTGGSTHVLHRVTAKGLANQSAVTDYTTSYLSGASSAHYLDSNCTFTGGDLTFDPSHLIVFIKVIASGTDTDPAILYGVRLQYSTDLNDI